MALFDSKSQSAFKLKNIFWFLSLALMMNLLVCDVVSAARIKPLQKRNSFVSIGCLGLFNTAHFNRLDKICEECYSVTRTPGIESEFFLLAFYSINLILSPSLGSCRANCFRNNEFLKCVDLLLYSNQKNELNDIADSLYGS